MPQADYAPVNGLKLYYEVHGEPRADRVPLVLLHGGGDTIGTSFAKILPLLARSRQVIAFERQGFGHTADIADRPFDFDRSADETVGLFDHLKLDRADVLGFSNGGTIALRLAIRHPTRVRRLVSVSGLFARDGVAAEFWKGFDGATLEMMPQELQDAYRAASPHPERLQSFFDKCVAVMRDFQDIPRDALGKIAAPTLVMSGDADVPTPEHGVELFHLIQAARLAIVPDVGHELLHARASVCAEMIDAFLDAKEIGKR